MAESNSETSTPLPVNQDFLETQLNKVYGTTSKIVKTENELIGQGKGFMSYMTKTTLTYDPEDRRLPRKIVCKKPTLDHIKVFEIMADFTIDNLRDLHNREIRMYEYLTKYGPSPIPMAKCIYKEELTVDGTGMLILEFVEGRSVHFNEDTTTEQVLTLAGYIGKLQAYGLDHPEFKELFPPLLVNPFENGVSMVKAAARDLRERYPGVFTMSEEKAQEIALECAESSKMFTGELGHQYPLALSLGDMQPNNVLWVEKGGELTDQIAAFLDFQIAFAAVPGYDLSVICSMNYPPESYQKNRNGIIDRYYSSLKSSVANGVEAPVMDDVMESLRQFHRYLAAVGMSFVQQMEIIKEKMHLKSERIMEIARRIDVVLK